MFRPDEVKIEMIRIYVTNLFNYLPRITLFSFSVFLPKFSVDSKLNLFLVKSYEELNYWEYWDSDHKNIISEKLPANNTVGANSFILYMFRVSLFVFQKS